ncbi:uncharacterized protein SPSC_06690 [Sporisorium scitamineum]|uniref:WD40 repeat-like protein n=1 Tax=Sporisorium scitamineum TaxID=49012 RepID=A0A0F7S3Y2_9BASI|nr:uncharacterized protein SPSC_06690 [Sporisorium scitamineum]CDS01712.1 hypothetical protein [Sporisorium scitamineum]
MAFHRTSLFDSPTRRTISWSVSHRRKYQLDDQLINRLDITEELGDDNGVGHAGCVNALSWSPSGQLLASGGDDRDVALWKLDPDHAHPVTDPHFLSRFSLLNPSSSARDQASDSETTPSVDRDDNEPGKDGVWNANTESDLEDIVELWPHRQFPKMGFGMLGKIETGHRANIFSVKWAPNASERRLFTCAGDSHVRVFDINYMSAGPAQGIGAEGDTIRTSAGREYSFWHQDNGACIRLFRCHRGRAKRISTEVSPDVFLTCAEDGDVRQMDLRAPHTCRSRTGGSCPPPLAHYSSVLYSLSVSKLEPWLFAVAGESSLVYLHDRRMIPRLLKRDWGMSFSTDEQRDALTMCVRSFGLPPGGFEAPWAQNDGRTVMIDNSSQPVDRRLLMGNHNSITACKLSEHNGRELLVSYSSGQIYRFDIYDEPGILQANLENARFSLDAQERSQTPEETSTSASKAQEPEINEDMDSEKAEAETLLKTPEKETNEIDSTNQDEQGQRRAEPPESRNADEMSHADDVDIELEESVDDSEDEIETEEQDMDEDEDEEDEGDISDEDLMHLLQEDEQDQLDLNESRKTPVVYPRSAYKGHSNSQTIKDVAFAGGTDNYVMSGSDDGNWFMWDKLTSEIKGIWRGDTSVVNVMAMHPELPVFAISGIDETVKIFAPISVTPSPPPPPSEEQTDTADTGASRKRARTDTVEAFRAHKVADRLADKDSICQRNQRSPGADRITANIFWHLHPQLLGLDPDEDPERQLEGDCIVM